MKSLKNLSRKGLIELIRNFAHRQKDLKIRNLILEALFYAIEMHEHQKDRPDGPYINHVLRVAVFLILLGVTNPYIIIGALLHDTVEDQVDKILEDIPPSIRGTNKREDAFIVLERIFGSFSVRLIKAVTNPDWSAIEEKSKRNKLYVAHVQEILNEFYEAAMIKLSDFYDNGLDVCSIVDPHRKKTLSIKYLPLFDMFIETVPKFANGILSKEKIVDIVRDLENVRAFAEREVAEF